jgi:hypothetical protein
MSRVSSFNNCLKRLDMPSIALNMAATSPTPLSSIGLVSLVVISSL